MTSDLKGLSVSILRGEAIHELRQLVPEWERLWHGHPARTAFGLPGWAIAWWRAFGASHSLRCAMVRAAGDPVALIPLALDSDRTLRLLGTPHADYGDMLGGTATAAAALEAALDALAADADWDRLELINVREDAVMATALAGLPPRWRARLLSERGQPCPAAVAEGDPAAMYDMFVRKKSLRQFTRTLARLGDLVLTHYEDPAEAQTQLKLLFRQHAERSAVAGRRSQFLDDPRERQLFRFLVDELDPRTVCRMSVLWAGDNAVACHFGFEAAGRFVYYKPTFDVDLWALSAGQVLLTKMFEYAMSHELPVFDFSIGDEAYKYRFANHVPHTFNHRLVRTRPRAVVERLAHDGRKFVRARPELHRLVRRLRGRPQDGQGAVRIAPSKHGAFLIPAGNAGAASQTARLSDLAWLAVRRPADFPVSELDAMRIRLRRGDRCLMVREPDGVAALGWLRQDGVAGLPDNWRGPVLDQIWLRPGVTPVPAITALAAGGGADEPVLALVPAGPMQESLTAASGWKLLGVVNLTVRDLPVDA